MELDPQQAHKLPQELGSKLGPFIHHHAIWQTMTVKQIAAKPSVQSEGLWAASLVEQK